MPGMQHQRQRRARQAPSRLSAGRSDLRAARRRTTAAEHAQRDRQRRGGRELPVRRRRGQRRSQECDLAVRRRSRSTPPTTPTIATDVATYSVSPYIRGRLAGVDRLPARATTYIWTLAARPTTRTANSRRSTEPLHIGGVDAPRNLGWTAEYDAHCASTTANTRDTADRPRARRAALRDRSAVQAVAAPRATSATTSSTFETTATRSTAAASNGRRRRAPTCTATGSTLLRHRLEFYGSTIARRALSCAFTRHARRQHRPAAALGDPRRRRVRPARSRRSRRAIPDPVERAHAEDQRLLRTGGIPADLAIPRRSSSSARCHARRRRRRLSAALLGVRNTHDVQRLPDEQRARSRRPGAAPPSLRQCSRTTRRAAARARSYSHRLTAHSRRVSAARRQRRQTTGESTTNRRAANSWTAALTSSRQLGRRTIAARSNARIRRFNSDNGSTPTTARTPFIGIAADAVLTVAHVRILLRLDRQAVPAQSRIRRSISAAGSTGARWRTSTTACTRTRASSSSPARSARARRRSSAACSTSSIRGKVVAAQLVSTQLDAEDTLRMVGAAFGLREQGHPKVGAAARRSRRSWSASGQQGKRALLIVDEAQNLTPRAVEELRMLSNFQLGDARAAAELSGRPAGVPRRHAEPADAAVAPARRSPPATSVRWTSRRRAATSSTD